MPAVSKRDISNLTRSDLLEDYSERAERGDDPVVRYALRNSSVSIRDLLVRMATNLEVSSEQLKQLVFSNELLDDEIRDYDQLGNLGRLALLQNRLQADTEYGVRLLNLANRPVGDALSMKNALALAQHYVLSGNSEKALELMDLYPDLKSVSFGYIPAELDNPFTQGSEATMQRWLQAFNQVFTEHELTPVTLRDGTGTPFDRLTTAGAISDEKLSDKEPLVSVVLTVFQPVRSRLLTSVHSILDQTWKNLEIIVVDDDSGDTFHEIFREVEELDQRITVIRAPENMGTYVARNIGYQASKGDFITGQDDDDWSHPERITYQVRAMQENPAAVGCRVRAVRCEDSLNRVYLNVLPVGQNASSLFIRREAYEASNGFLKVRKAGDTEFHKRIEAITGQRVIEIQKPLSIIRILSASLSRGDFSPGWMHESRYSFRSSYTRWHKTSPTEELSLSKYAEPAIKIPSRLAVDRQQGQNRELDVVFAGDWQSFGGPQKSMLEEIKALKQQNLRIGILDLESARFMFRRQRLPLNNRIQDLINSGEVDEVFYDETIHIRLLILRYPPILQFFRHERSSLSIDRMIILANQAPAELDGSDIRYIVEDVDEAARSCFGQSPTWVPQGPQVRKVLYYYLKTNKLASYDMPGILDVSEWWLERLWYRSRLPVVGRHSRDNKMKWPADRAVLEQVYRTDGQHDIRIMGGVSTAPGMSKAASVPPAWSVYKTDEMSVRRFLYSLDYFVYYQNPNAIEAFGRAILEAIAAGLVVILPKHFQEVFGDAAIYAAPEDVEAVITRYHSDFTLYQEQLLRSREVLYKKFSYEAYQQLIQNILVDQQTEASL